METIYLVVISSIMTHPNKLAVVNLWIEEYIYY